MDLEILSVQEEPGDREYRVRRRGNRWDRGRGKKKGEERVMDEKKEGRGSGSGRK